MKRRISFIILLQQSKLDDQVGLLERGLAIWLQHTQAAENPRSTASLAYK
jgi:hypothetical protein